MQPETLSHALIGGIVPKGYSIHLTHLLDEAPVPLVLMAVEEAAANGGMAPESVWGRVVEETTAQSARNALGLVDSERGRYRAVLLDLHTPTMDGGEVAAALGTRYAPETLPIGALTAAAFEEDRERCQRVDMNDFVIKLVSAERLRAVLVKWGRHAG